MSDTIFAKIVSGEIPTDFVYEDEHCVAINDINPLAPVHVLIIPRRAITMLSEATAADQALLGHLMLTAASVARQLGVEEGFRLMVNNGAAAGMTVPHLHLHILAGRRMSEASLAGGLDT